MNCKPGDLAVVVRSAVPECVGRFVNVESFLGTDPLMDGFIWRDVDCWLVTPVGEPLRDGQGNEWLRAACGDAWLRPIRDPGDDAVDESRAWLPPVPTTADVWKPKRQVENA